MTGDKLAEVSGKGGKGRVLWRPSRNVDANASQRAVPPWADPDAQPPPPPSNFYAMAPAAAATVTQTHKPLRSATGMSTGVQANPNPTHFNRPSPGASPVPVRKSLFRTNVPMRSLSNESLNKALPWATKKDDAPPSNDARETDTLCPMVMTGDSRSRMSQMRGQATSRSTSLPRVGHTGGESLSSHSVSGGGGKLPAGRGVQEAPPPPTPIQSESKGGRGASDTQSVPRPQGHAQAGIHSSHHTGVDPPDSTDVRHHPPGRMVSAKPTMEAKAPLPNQQPEQQGSPTPWRKVRTAPADTPPEQGSPTPWRKNLRSQDTAAKAAPSQQQQPSWQGSKDDVSTASVSEGPAAAPSVAKGQEPPWRKATSQQTISVQSGSSTSSSVVHESTSTTVKQTQVLQTSQVSVGVRSENVSKVVSNTDSTLSHQTTQPQANWRHQQPKNQPTAQPVPSATSVSHPSTAPTAQPTSTQPPAPATHPVPIAKDVTSGPVANKPVSAVQAVNKQGSPVPSVGKTASPIPAVSHSPSPIPNKITSQAPAANKAASPAPAFYKPPSQTPAVNKPASPIPAVNKPASPAPAANKPAHPAAAVNKPASHASVVNKPASPAPAVNKAASPIPAANKAASPAPAVNKPVSQSPAEIKQSSQGPTADKSASPSPAITKPVTPPPPAVTKRATPPPAVTKPATPPPPLENKSTPVIAESPPSVTAVYKNVCPVPVDQLPTAPLSSIDDKKGIVSEVKPAPQKAEGVLHPEQAPTQPLAPTLFDTRSPTPPLPPKQTAASIVSAPAVPLAPKPPLTPVDQLIETPPTYQPIQPPPPPATKAIPPSPPTQPILPPPPPTQPILPHQLNSVPQRKSPPPGTVSASMLAATSVSTSVGVPPPPPSLPGSSPVEGSKPIGSMTSVAYSPLISSPMPVPGPPPAPVPIPPPEPLPKTMKSNTPSPAVDRVQPLLEKVDDKGTKETEPSTIKTPEKPMTSSSPHPEFPPPPPLEESGPSPSASFEVDQALPPPPPSFLHDQKPTSPPMSLFADHEERADLEDEDFPSPDYVRQSVNKRIKAFEKQASKDEEPPPADRPTPIAKPVAPWVKKTSAGNVNPDVYWGMTSPEEDPGWTVPTEREVELAKTRSQPKEVTTSNAKGASIPPPPPSAPTAGLKGPSAGKPSPGPAHTTAKVATPSRPRAPPIKQRSTSVGDYDAQYFVPEDKRLSNKMPAEGDVPTATTPEETKPVVKPDDALFDPWCDPKNPRVINFQDVSAAAFKIKSGIMNTPCTLSHMSTFTDMEIYFKKEFNQYTGSFKERGARYTLLMLTEDQKKKGVIAASAGNHALALSYHGQDLGIPVTVVMPLVAPIMKVQACKQYGANIIVRGNDIGECREIALRMSREQNLLYINGYDHPHILAGQGTLGLEIVEQVDNIDAVVIPVGGGGLIAGVALAVKALYPNVQIIGVESERCASFSGAMKAGHPVYVKAETTLADGLAVPTVGVNAFATACKLVDKVVQVKEEWIAIAILRLVECEKAVVEGAGATALAAILAGELPELKGKRIVIPLCGGNIDTTVLGRCLERGLAADGRLVKFTVTVSDRPGGIAELTRLLANLGVSIKDMMHERAWIKSDIFSVEVKVIAETRDYDHYRELRSALESQYKRLRFVHHDGIHDEY